MRGEIMKGKKIWLALALGAAMLAACPAEAADVHGGAKAGQTEAKMPPRRKPMTEEQMVTILTQKYFLTEADAKEKLAAGTNFRELEKAALYSYISGKSVDEILALKKDEPWQRVEVLVGAVGDRRREGELRMKAENLSRWWGIDKKTAFRLMKKGWPMHYVKVAWILAKHSDLTVEDILADKKYPENWKAWTLRRLGADAETYDAWIAEYPNPTYFPGQYF